MSSAHTDEPVTNAERRGALLWANDAWSRKQADAELERLSAEAPEKLEELDAVVRASIRPLITTLKREEEAKAAKQLALEQAQKRTLREGYLGPVNALADQIDALHVAAEKTSGALSALIEAVARAQDALPIGATLSLTRHAVACRIGEEALRLAAGQPSQLVDVVMQEPLALVERLRQAAPSV